MTPRFILLVGLSVLLILPIKSIHHNNQRDDLHQTNRLGSSQKDSFHQSIIKRQGRQVSSQVNGEEYVVDAIDEVESTATQLPRPEKCIPIEIQLCKDVGYNLTYMPNAFNHETQDEAGLENECVSRRDSTGSSTNSYSPGMAKPKPSNNRILPPAGSRTKHPTSSRQPSDRGAFAGTHNVNITNSLIEHLVSSSRLVGLDKIDPTVSHRQGEGLDAKKMTELLLKQPNSVLTRLKGRTKCEECKCRAPFQAAYKPPYNEVVTGNVTGCLLSCRLPWFNKIADKSFISFWLGLWAVVCLLSTSATILTFLTNTARFQYPERPIIYLSICYMLTAIGYLVRAALGHEAIACDGPVIIQGKTGPAECSIVFLLIYVFGMASSSWWVMLTVTWFLAAGLKWGNEAIAKYSQIYHFLAWFFPGLQAILVLFVSGIDGDPVSGLCYVGSTSSLYSKLFVLGPLCIYLGLGTIFLISGFVALFRIRSAIKLQAHGQNRTAKLEKLMLRIGIFGLLYTIPAVVVIGCIIYELYYRQQWYTNHNCQCKSLDRLVGELANQPENVLKNMPNLVDRLIKSGYDTNPSDSIEQLITNNHLSNNRQSDWIDQSQPEYAIFMLKYFMSLVVGITSGFWIWSSKTIESWRSCCRSVIGRLKGTTKSATIDAVKSVDMVTPSNQLQIPLASPKLLMNHSGVPIWPQHHHPEWSPNHKTQIIPSSGGWSDELTFSPVPGQLQGGRLLPQTPGTATTTTLLGTDSSTGCTNQNGGSNISNGATASYQSEERGRLFGKH